MPFPFSLYATFIPNTTPVIGADFLNQSQEMFFAMAAHLGFGAQKLWAHSYDGATIKIETLHGAIVRDYALNIYTAPIIPTPPTVVTAGNLDPAGAFTASTWYYVYLRSNNRLAEFVLSTTPPGADLRWKGTDDTRRFLFSFKTLSTGGVIDPFTHRDGITTYIQNYGHYEATFTTTSWTASAALTRCPPHARLVLFQVRIERGATEEYLRILPKGAAAQLPPTGVIPTTVYATSPSHREHIWVEVDATPAIEGQIGLMDAGNEAGVGVAGWNEFR